MFWIATDLIKAGELLLISFVVLLVVVSLVARNVFHVDGAEAIFLLSSCTT